MEFLRVNWFVTLVVCIAVWCIVSTIISARKTKARRKGMLRDVGRCRVTVTYLDIYGTTQKMDVNFEGRWRWWSGSSGDDVSVEAANV